MPSAIEVDGLVKRYGTLAVVDGIGFSRGPWCTVFSFPLDRTGLGR